MLSDMVYPLTSRQVYGSESQMGGRATRARRQGSQGQTGFSSNMTNTLRKMKKKY